MVSVELTDDSKALVLLCTTIALPRGHNPACQPLTAVEWSGLAKRVAASVWKRPAGLFGKSLPDLWDTLGLDESLAARVVRLLDRGGQLAIELERLAARGIWVITRADPVYPARLRERLMARAPVVLFGAGPVELLSSRGIGVVGSRDVDESGECFAKQFGERCAAAGLTLYSGAARGVDRLAMTAALEREGVAVGVLADSLERALRDPTTRHYIAGQRLAMVTPFHPAVGFTVANAMARNKLVYCLADFAVVVASSLEGGGTRAGALENLKAGWVPLFVRADPCSPAGNRELLARGGIPLCLDSIPAGVDLGAWFATHTSHTAGARTHETRRASESVPPVVSPVLANAELSRDASDPPGSDPCVSDADRFEVNRSYLDRYLQEWRTPEEISTFCRLKRPQVTAWLKRAVATGRVVKQGRPAKYRAIGSVDLVVQHTMPLGEVGKAPNGH